MKSKRKVIMLGILMLMIVSMAGVGIYYWYNSTYFVYTEDAKLDGDLLKVSSQISGKLLEFDMEEGDMVDKEQIVGRQEMAGQADSNLDTSIIRSPNLLAFKSKHGCWLLYSRSQLRFVAHLWCSINNPPLFIALSNNSIDKSLANCSALL